MTPSGDSLTWPRTADARDPLVARQAASIEGPAISSQGSPARPFAARRRGVGARWLPISIIVIWWFGTFLLYLSPWPLEYELTAVPLVGALWILCCISVVTGFAIGSNSSPRSIPAIGEWLPRVGLVLQWALFPIVVSQYSGLALGELGAALADQGAAYRAGTAAIESGAGARLPFTVLLAVTNMAALTSLPYYAYAWLSARKHAVPAVLAVSAPILLTFYTGRDSLLAPTVLSLVAATLVALGRGRLVVTTGLKWAVALAGLALTALFVARKFSRYVIDGVTYATSCPPGTTCVDPPSTGSFSAAVQTLASYATQGYEGLGHALGARWVFGGGYAHSPALRGIVDSEAQSDLVMDQLDQLDWSSGGFWSTGLSHIANDVPWPLIPVAILLLGLLLRRVWDQSLRSPDPVNIALLCYWFFLLFMMPQNLTLALNGPQYVAVLGLTAIWVVRSLVYAAGGRPTNQRGVWDSASSLGTRRAASERVAWHRRGRASPWGR